MRQYILTYPCLEVATLLVTILCCMMVPAAFRDSVVKLPPRRDVRVSSQALADVRHLLVTVGNPKSSTDSHLDFERCSALHNAIVKHRWVASGHDMYAHRTTMIDDIQSAPLIWINAFPGTGKYTIASILAKELMGGQCTLIHNHDLIDAVTLPREHPMYRASRKHERAKAFAQHVLAPESMGRCVIFTGMLK